MILKGAAPCWQARLGAGRGRYTHDSPGSSSHTPPPPSRPRRPDPSWAAVGCVAAIKPPRQLPPFRTCPRGGLPAAVGPELAGVGRGAACPRPWCRFGGGAVRWSTAWPRGERALARLRLAPRASASLLVHRKRVLSAAGTWGSVRGSGVRRWRPPLFIITFIIFDVT